MAAVIRLKRHLSEEPVEALVINCKRQKRNESDETEEKETKTVLKFAGTIKEQDEDITQHIKRISSKNEIEDSYKKHVPDLSFKNRREFKENLRNSRFKVVNLSRSINDSDASNKTDDQKLVTTVLDVESEEKDDNSPDANFVYDLYYTISDDLGDIDEKSENFHVLPIEPELVFDDYRDTADGNDYDSSSEDSNAENNWRNDYPDEDDAGSIGENDMRQAMQSMNFEDDLSSDDGQEGFTYSIDSESAGFEEELDQSDVRRYGELYARFKARQKKEEERYNGDFFNEEADDISDDYSD